MISQLKELKLNAKTTIAVSDVLLALTKRKPEKN